jgi:hypothetical protein
MIAAGWETSSLLPDSRNGKSNIDAALASLAQEAKARPVVVVRDLDSDASCGPQWITQQSVTARWLTIRIAVRSIEAWFLADRSNAAKCLRVAERIITTSPDDEPNAKLALVALARRSSSNAIKGRIVPRVGFSAVVGTGYAAWFEESCADWDLRAAEKHSESLRRAVKAFATLRERYEDFLNGNG